MQCERVQDLLKMDYLDGELEGYSKLSVDEHITACPECRNLKNALMSQRASLKRIGPAEVPAGVWDGIKTAVAVSGPRPASLNLAPVSALAAALAIIVLVIFAGTKLFVPPEQPSEYSIDGDLTQYDLGTSIEEHFL